MNDGFSIDETQEIFSKVAEPFESIKLDDVIPSDPGNLFEKAEKATDLSIPSATFSNEIQSGNKLDVKGAENFFDNIGNRETINSSEISNDYSIKVDEYKGTVLFTVEEANDVLEKTPLDDLDAEFWHNVFEKAGDNAENRIDEQKIENELPFAENFVNGLKKAGEMIGGGIGQEVGTNVAEVVGAKDQPIIKKVFEKLGEIYGADAGKKYANEIGEKIVNKVEEGLIKKFGNSVINEVKERLMEKINNRNSKV